MTRRRARATKLTNGLDTTDETAHSNAITNMAHSVALQSCLANGNLLQDDQYFASPKRKDCKMDNVTEVAGSTEETPITHVNSSNLNKSPNSNKTKTERNIGEYILKMYITFKFTSIYLN